MKLFPVRLIITAKWTEIVQALFSIFSLVGVIFIIIQIDQVERAIKGETYSKIYDQEFALFQNLLNDSTYYDYFYEGKVTTPGTIQHKKVTVLIAMFADYIEHICLQKDNLDDDKILADLVYRIQTVIRLYFGTTECYKIFATQDEKIFRNAAPKSQTQTMPLPAKFDVIKVETNCPRCGTKHLLYGKFVNKPQIDKDLTNQGRKSIIGQDRLTCTCGFEIDILGLKNNLENQLGKKFI